MDLSRYYEEELKIKSVLLKFPLLCDTKVIKCFAEGPQGNCASGPVGEHFSLPQWSQCKSLGQSW